MTTPDPNESLPAVPIENADKVLAHFGDWPHFHDMEVVSLHLDRGNHGNPWIEFVILAWLNTGKLAPQGHVEQTAHAHIRFRCEGVTSCQFDDFNHQNVLDGLNFSRPANNPEDICINFVSIYGLGGSVVCHSVRVVEVVPTTPNP